MDKKDLVSLIFIVFILSISYIQTFSKHYLENLFCRGHIIASYYKSKMIQLENGMKKKLSEKHGALERFKEI